MGKDKHFLSVSGSLDRMLTLKAEKLFFNYQTGTFIDDSHRADNDSDVKPLILEKETGW